MAVVTFVLVGIGLLLFHAVRAPSLLAIARTCDHGLGQRQRLSTAFEVLDRHGTAPSSIIEQRLLADVERRLRELDLGRAVRPSTSRRLRTTVAVSAVIAGLALAVPVPVPIPAAPETVAEVAPAAPTTRPTLTPDDVDATVALAESVAERLSQDPLAERDPFLRAVSEGFSDLALELANESIDIAEANEIVDELLSLLDDVSERTGGAFDDVVSEAMPEGIDRGSGEDSNATIPGFGSEVTEGEEGRAVPDQVDDRPAQASGAASEGSALERLAEALERRAEERAARAPEEGTTEAFGGDGSNPYGDQVNVARESTDEGGPGSEPLLRAEGDAAGRAVGAAQQSSDAAGDAAGGGSAELQGDPADFERDDANVEMTPLQAGEQADGRRLETSFAPTEGDVRERDVTEAPPERAFDRARERGTPSRALGWTHRDVVRRYFLPDAAEAAETSQ